MKKTPHNPSTETTAVHPIRVGVWNYYEELTTNGFIFKTPNTSIGHNLLKPWCDLYAYGQSVGIHFVTLDQISTPEELDAIIFMDRPRFGDSSVDTLMNLRIRKYLMLYECEVIKADNWDLEYHKKFDRIFTWNDSLVDGLRYIKTNFAIDTTSPYDFEVIKTAFHQRKLVTIIAGAKQSKHQNELYSHRLSTIRWFEANAPENFDLYGIGWDPRNFPSYRGKVGDKLATLSHYRFAICYENAKNSPGYITEKILDCFLAGTIPVYGGAPNIEHWIPADCFINISQFESYIQLYEFITNMDNKTHSHYLDRIHDFLTSSKAYPFSIECFIHTLTSVIDWDVRTGRGESQTLLSDLQDNSQNVHELMLLQNQSSMRIELIKKQQAIQIFKEENNAEIAIRKSLQNTGQQDVIVTIGYGDELPIYKRARALWEFYATFFPNVRIVFFRSSNKLQCGEVIDNGYELLVGTDEIKANPDDNQGYKNTGAWSAKENYNQIHKQISLFKYLLRNNPKPFHLFCVTVTSIVDFRGFFEILNLLPKSNCFAGKPGRISSPDELSGLTIISGANSLFSSDVVETLCERYDPQHIYTSFPNDVWQALLLQDIPRTPLPFFSFTKPRSHLGTDSDLSALISKLLAQGHYHFRIKTTGEEFGYGPREDTDIWIMLQVIEKILQTHPSPQARYNLINEFTLNETSGSSKTLNSFISEGQYTGHLHPLDDRHH